MTYRRPGCPSRRHPQPGPRQARTRSAGGIRLRCRRELTEHTASVPVIIQMIPGAVSIELSGKRHLLGPQSWLYLEAGEPHSVYAEEPAHMLTMIRAS
jgi:quercetin dioxygenase-like cupin family protein